MSLDGRLRLLGCQLHIEENVIELRDSTPWRLPSTGLRTRNSGAIKKPDPHNHVIYVTASAVKCFRPWFQVPDIPGTRRHLYALASSASWFGCRWGPHSRSPRQPHPQKHVTKP